MTNFITLSSGLICKMVFESLITIAYAIDTI